MIKKYNSFFKRAGIVHGDLVQTDSEVANRFSASPTCHALLHPIALALSCRAHVMGPVQVANDLSGLIGLFAEGAMLRAEQLPGPRMLMLRGVLSGQEAGRLGRLEAAEVLGMTLWVDAGLSHLPLRRKQ